VDDDRDGFPNTLPGGGPVRWPRVLAGGLPEDLTERVAPLLVFLDRAGIRYDVTSDLDLALTRNPRASDRKGVLLAGSERWVTRGYARRLRRFVTDGGTVSSFGVASLRRGVALQRARGGAAGVLARPTQPVDTDPFGAQLEPIRRVEGEPPPLAIQAGADSVLLTNFDGELAGFDVVEESVPPSAQSRTRLVIGLSQRPQAEEAPAEDDRFALTATRLGKGTVIRVGIPGWAERLDDDPEVAQLTLNIADVTRGVRPRVRTRG
jgi:hypothetical protein